MAIDEQTKGSRLLRSPAFKFFLIVLLTVAMAVPLFFIQLLLSDREQTASGAATDVAAGWGGPQVVAGPMLFVPYTQVGDQTRRTAVVLPENLDMRVKADSGTRSRGIFAIPVYRADIKMHATFDKAALARAVPPDAVIVWDDVSVAIRVSDAHGLADNVTLLANGRKIAFGAGIDAGASTKTSGIQAPLSLNGPADLTLDTQFSLRGSREFSVAPLGRRTTASISSPWNSPSFFGAVPPRRPRRQRGRLQSVVGGALSRARLRAELRGGGRRDEPDRAARVRRALLHAGGLTIRSSSAR